MMMQEKDRLQRADVLRELNLYPLWHRRVVAPADFYTGMAEAGLDEALPEIEPVASRPAKPVKRGNDCSKAGWSELSVQVGACHLCDLRDGCTQTVMGAGDHNADWMLVGAWPTEDDEQSGEPFSGQAGVLLDNMLAAIGLSRGKKVYLSHVVKCCGSIRRAPQAGQIGQCQPYLKREIQLVQPRLIVALGHAAATILLGDDRPWPDLLGRLHEYPVQDENDEKGSVPLLVTHHPAALLLTPQNKAQVWRDLQLARETMQSLNSR